MESGMDFEMFYDIVTYLNNISDRKISEKAVAIRAYNLLERDFMDTKEYDMISGGLYLILKEIYPTKDFDPRMDFFDTNCYLCMAWHDIQNR